MPTAPLRILQVNSLFTGGGVDNQTLTLAKGLQDLGEHVVLAIPSGTRYEARAQAAGLSLAAIPARSWLKLSLVLQCASLIRRHRAQILHIHQGRDYWPCILAAKLAGQGTRVVVTRHLMTRPRGLSRRFLLRCVDIIAVSQAVAAVLHAHLKGPASRIHQIYCGTDFSAISPVRTPAAVAFRERMGWPPAAVVFAVIGTFHPPLGKGQPEFLQAAAQLKERYPQARFAIIGHGEMEADLKRQIQESGLGAVAAVFPFEDQIATCMSAIDVLVHPTRKGEAFGLVITEALAAGRPVIASRKDGIPECFTEGEHGLLLPPGDVPALAAAMARLLAEPELRERWGTAGSRHVRQKFSQETLARLTRELYRQCLGQAQ